jgi:hypothetical protein
MHRERWRDQDEPMVEAIGDTLARWHGVASQEQAGRVVDTLIDVCGLVMSAARL